MPDATSVYACETQPIVVEGLRRVLAETDDLTFGGWWRTLGEAANHLRTEPADVVLVDQSFGVKQIGGVIADLSSSSIHTHTVVWAAECSANDCFRALQAGARGVLLKALPITSLLDCLRTVRSGRLWIDDSVSEQMSGYLVRDATPRLTRRERDIVHCVCRGLRNRDIAAELGITPGTVKVHLMHVFEKTGVKDRFELAVRGRRLLLDEPVASAPTKGE